MLTVSEAARRTGRHPETIRRWIWSGRMRAEKVGGRHLIADAELERATAGRSSSASLTGWLDELYRLHDETGFTGRGLPSGAELVRADRESR